MVKPSRNTNLKFSLVEKIYHKFKSKTWQVTIPLFILLSFLPIRVLCLFAVDPSMRASILYIGLGTVGCSAFFMEFTIPYLLNTTFVQVIFFIVLQIENFLYSIESRIEMFLVTGVICVCIMLIPAFLLKYLGVTLWTWCFFVLMVTFAGFKLRRFFVFPEENLALDMYQGGCLKLVHKDSEFNWSIVLFNMDQSAKKLYGSGVNNRLGEYAKNIPMRVVGVCYMTLGTGILKFFEGVAVALGQNDTQISESFRKDSVGRWGLFLGVVISTFFGVKEFKALKDARDKQFELDQQAQKDDVSICWEEVIARARKSLAKDETTQIAKMELYRKMYLDLLKAGLTDEQAFAYVKSFDDLMKQSSTSFATSPSYSNSKAFSLYEESWIQKITSCVYEVFS